MRDHRDVDPAPDTEIGALDGRNVIAVIGIDRYENWQPLSNAVNDAEAARREFQRLGFVEITQPLLDEQATRQAIDALVTDELKNLLGPRDSLVLFYAGHGGTREHVFDDRTIQSGYLIPVDAVSSPSRMSTCIDVEDWLKKVSLLPAKHVLVILDACHSGIALDSAVDKYREAVTSGAISLSTLSARRSRRVITSALPDERALDSGPKPGNSLFTGYLIEALQVGLLQEGRRVATGTSLGEYVQRRVREHSHSRQTPASGTFGLDRHGELVIRLRPLEEAPAPVPPARRYELIPADVLADLDRPDPMVRVSAAKTLAKLLWSSDMEQVYAARQKLEELADDRVRSVAKAARAELSRRGFTWRSVAVGAGQPSHVMNLAYVLASVLMLSGGGFGLSRCSPDDQVPTKGSAWVVPDLSFHAPVKPRAKPIVLRVRSDPAGAEIWLDGRLLDVRTPAAVEVTDEAARRGRVALSVHMTGYEAVDQQVALAGFTEQGESMIKEVDVSLRSAADIDIP